MRADDWLAVIARIGVPADALFLDEGAAVPAKPFALRGRHRGDAAKPSGKLWPRDTAEAEVAAIGVTVLFALLDVQLLALRIASVAVERGLMPVILTTRDQTGLEPYGFRIERLTDRDGVPDAVEMAELSAFWDFALVIDAADIALLG